MDFVLNACKFEKLFKELCKHGTADYDSKIFNYKHLLNHKGLYKALVCYFSSTIKALNSVDNTGNELGSLDYKSAHRSAKKFTRFLHRPQLKQLANETNLVEEVGLRKYWYRHLYNSRDFYFSVYDRPNYSYKNLKYLDKIVINHGKKYYVNFENSNIFATNYNHNTLTKGEFLKKWLQSGHDFGKDFQIMNNPRFNNETDKPRVCIINHIQFFYNPKQVLLKRVLEANVPFLPIDQDSFDCVKYDKKGDFYEY